MEKRVGSFGSELHNVLMRLCHHGDHLKIDFENF